MDNKTSDHDNAMNELTQEIQQLAASIGKKFKIDQTKVEKFRETFKVS